MDIEVDDQVWLVSIASLKRRVNPLARGVWRPCEFNGKSLRAAVTHCLVSGAIEATPWDAGPTPAQTGKTDSLYHARRIAYLVRHADTNPIVIDVGVPGLFAPQHLIWDGNHRLAAAIYRGDDWIAVTPSGSMTLFHGMFRTRRAPSPESRAIS